MLLFKTKSSVKVGQLHRYRITYIPSKDNISPIPKSLHLKVRNTELFPLRAAYLNGPFILYVDVTPSGYDPFTSVTSHYNNPAFESQLKPAQSYLTELKLDPAKLVHEWTVDVVSQLIFSSSATVGFELSLGRDESSLAIDTSDGVFSSALTVSHLDTSAIWSTPPPDTTKPIHLIVISHGLHSNTGADMLFLKSRIEMAAAQAGDNVIVRGYFDNVCRTERGVKYLGKRLAQYVATNLREPGIDRISFVGHSLGGLVMTYAIAYIHVHYPDFFDTIKPVNFIALATPFLGLSNENPIYVKFALDFGVVGKSGQDLGLTWKPSSPFTSSVESKPLLRILPTGPAAEILRRFKRRTVYANAVNDGIVPLRTSALLFLDWRGLAKANQALRGERVTDSHSSSHVDVREEDIDDVDNVVDTDVPEPTAQREKTDTGFMSALKPIQYALSYLRPQAMHKRPAKIYDRSQTLSDTTDDDDAAAAAAANERLAPLPKTSVFVSATSILNPPQPPTEFILDVDSRPKTIFHDRIYRPEDLPTKSDCKTEKAKTEERIARAWHDHLTWRKVLVQLEPDAHNNIVVRRTYANAYGWPVIGHLVQHHFLEPYDPDAGHVEKAATPRSVDDQTDMLDRLTRGRKSTHSIDSTDSARYEAEDFVVEDSDEDEEPRDAIASSAAAESARNDYSSQTFADFVNYIADWSPMRMGAGDRASAHSQDTVTSTHTLTEDAVGMTRDAEL
ncbi:putative serine esterase-domain-containing protein [Lipomyces arxii]|uniref:putative serine esterase-domain-containing protein n=1 Tax=Lipomyces arxii TaxID=56418 RepID=UPI0034CD5F4F